MTTNKGKRPPAQENTLEGWDKVIRANAKPSESITCPECGHHWAHHEDEWPCDAVVEDWDESHPCGCTRKPPPAK